MHQQQQPSRQQLPKNNEQELPIQKKLGKIKLKKLQNDPYDQQKINNSKSKVFPTSGTLLSAQSTQIQTPEDDYDNICSIFFISFYKRLHFFLLKSKPSRSLKTAIFSFFVIPLLIPISIFYALFILTYFLIVWVIFIPSTAALIQAARIYFLLKIHPSCWYTLFLMIALEFIPFCLLVLYAMRLIDTLFQHAFLYDMVMLVTGRLTPVMRCKPFLGDHQKDFEQQMKKQEKYQCECICYCQSCPKCQLGKSKYPKTISLKIPINYRRLWCMSYIEDNGQDPILTAFRDKTYDSLKDQTEDMNGHVQQSNNLKQSQGKRKIQFKRLNALQRQMKERQRVKKELEKEKEKQREKQRAKYQKERVKQQKERAKNAQKNEENNIKNTKIKPIFDLFCFIAKNKLKQRIQIQIIIFYQKIEEFSIQYKNQQKMIRARVMKELNETSQWSDVYQPLDNSQHAKQVKRNKNRNIFGIIKTPGNSCIKQNSDKKLEESKENRTSDKKLKDSKKKTQQKQKVEHDDKVLKQREQNEQILKFQSTQEIKPQTSQIPTVQLQQPQQQQLSLTPLVIQQQPQQQNTKQQLNQQQNQANKKRIENNSVVASQVDEPVIETINESSVSKINQSVIQIDQSKYVKKQTLFERVLAIDEKMISQIRNKFNNKSRTCQNWGQINSSSRVNLSSTA